MLNLYERTRVEKILGVGYSVYRFDRVSFENSYKDELRENLHCHIGRLNIILSEQNLDLSKMSHHGKMWRASDAVFALNLLQVI